MKLKREPVPFGNFECVFKGWIYIILLFASYGINAQVVSITSSDPEAREVFSGAPNGTSFTISRPSGFLFSTTVAYSISGGTATLGTDFAAAAAGTVTLTATQNSATIVIPGGDINDDNLVEGTETIIVNLGNIVNGTPSPAQRSVTLDLVDNDIGIFTVTTTAAAAEEGQVEGNFRINLDKENATGAVVSLPFTLTGSAAGSDYTTIGQGTFTFPGGTQTRLLRIVPEDDDLVELPETVVLTLGSPTTGSPSPPFTVSQGGPGSRTVTITDNDTGTFTLQTTDADAAEQGQDTGRYLLTLDKENATGQNLTVTYTLGGSATNGSDYAVTGQAGTFTFPAGQTSRQLLITPVDDPDAEPDETVVLILGDPSNNTKFTYVQTPAAQRTITIADNDCAAGNAAPVLNNDPTAFCNNFTIGLDTYYDGARPNGTSLIWTLNENDPLNQDDWAPRQGDSPVSAPGDYFAFFWDETSNCNSPLSTLTLTRTTTPSAGTVTTPVNACNNANDDFGPTRIDLDDVITGQDNGAWAQTGGPAITIPNNNRLDFRGQAAGSYEFTYTTNTAVAPCTNPSSVVTITVVNCDPCEAGNEAPVLNTEVPTTFCGETSNSLNDYAPNAGPNGTTLRWALDDEDPTGSFVSNARIANPETGVYYGFYYDSVNDCTSPLLTVNIDRREIPEITGTVENSRCGEGTLVLSATASLDATIRWYAVATGGTPIRDGANFTTPNISVTTSYFVEATANTCVSPRTEVVATVNPQPSAGAPQNSSSCSDSNFGLTTLDLDSTFTIAQGEGTWSVTSGPSAVTLNAENVVDFQGSANGDYVFTFTTNGAVDPCENESAEVTISVSNCDTDDDGDGLLGGLESMLGTNPNEADTDGDGIEDGDEVGDDTDNPLNGDGDGIIDALDSNILDTDEDGVVDQLDPGNENPCVPERLNGQCDTDGDGISDLEEDTNGTDPNDACDPNATPNCADPIDLEVLKEVDILDANIDDEIIFTVTVNNLSDRNAINVMIGDMLETGFELSADAVPVASVGAYEIETGMWTIPEIAAMGSATLTIPVRVLEGGPYTNTAELLASIPEDNTPENNIAEVTLNIDLPEGIDLVLRKTAAIVDQNESLNIGNFQEDEVNPLLGQEIIFRLQVTNESNEDTVSRIKVVDSLSSAFGNPVFPPELPAEELEFNAETGVVTWTIPELLKNGVAQLEIRVQADSVGTYRNLATIDGSSPVDSENRYDNNSDEVIVNVSERTEAEFGIIFNQFSPNQDGVNDNLKINKTRTNEDGTEQEVDIAYSIKIFNRYGSLVFEGDQLQDEVIWDGTRDGKEVPDGTYFYVLNLNVLEELDGIDTNTTKKGWIQLIR